MISEEKPGAFSILLRFLTCINIEEGFLIPCVVLLREEEKKVKPDDVWLDARGKEVDEQLPVEGERARP